MVRKFATDIVGGATSEVITHNLNTRDVTVEVYTNGNPYDKVYPEIEHTSVNTITLRYGSETPAAAAYRVVVHG